MLNGMADHSIEIAALEALLNSAASSVSVDGLSTSFNLEQARKRLQELKASDDSTLANGGARPVRATIKTPFF